MPNIDNIEKKSFTKNNRDHLLNVNRKEIFYRDDIRSLFGYSLLGIAASLAVAGLIYVVGKKLIA